MYKHIAVFLLCKFQLLNKQLFEPKNMISEASILTTSLYDIHIRRWLKHFDRGNMLVMDGRSLQTQPIVAIRRAQNFLRISDSIPSKAFNFNNTIGLFCMHLKYVNNEDRIECPSRHSFLSKLRFLIFHS